MNITRYKTNPFLNDLIIPLGNKQVQISALGEDNNIVINQDTGEYLGTTSVVTYKKVDSSQFIKLFTQNIKLAFDLTQAGQKALYVLFWSVQQVINKDKISLDQYTLNEFLEDNQDLSMSIATFRRGLAELTKCKIIAMAERKGDYFINPNFLFNGNRIAFTTVIENEKTSKKQKNKEEEEKQIKFFEPIEE